MNQPIGQTAAVRSPAANDGPDILVLLRRYALLLAVGTIAGAGIATAIYWYQRRTSPLYRGTVEFQVLPPPNLIGNESQTNVVMNTDDTSQFIHRQVNIILQPEVLSEIIASKPFITDYRNPDDTNRRSQWLTENSQLPQQRLRKALRVVPKIESATFEISLDTHDPFEARELVNAIRDIYLSTLQSNNKSQSNSRLDQLEKAMQSQSELVKQKSNDLDAFRIARNVPALTARQQIELQSLQQLNEAVLTADKEARGALQAASSYNLLVLEAAKTNPALLTGTDAAGTKLADLILEKVQADVITQIAKNLGESDITASMITPDIDQLVQDDFEMRTLQDRKLSFELQLASASVVGANPQIPKQINAQIKKVEEQIDATRKQLQLRSFLRAREIRNSQLLQANAVAQLMRSEQVAQEKAVRELDTALVEYNQRNELLKTAQDVFDRITKQYTFARLSSGSDDTRVQQMVRAVVPDPQDFVWPSLTMYLPLGAASGFVLAFAVAYLLMLNDTRVRTPRDVTRTLQLPLLGFVPDESDDPALTGSIGTALITGPSSMIAESFRQIRSHLVAQMENTPIHSLLVASISPGGGASTVASNLAVGMALNERRVLLVDANFYRPSLNTLYKNIPVEGFSDLLEEPELASKAIVASAELPKLHLLGAGRQLGKASSEIFDSKAFRDLLEQLKARYDLVIFDGAPLNLVSDSVTLASRVDGVVSVIRAGEVSRGAVSRIREQLRLVHANIMGFVLNAAQVSNTGYFKENYRNFYTYAGQSPRRAPAPVGSR